LESAGSQKERETEENLEKGLLEEAGKRGKTWREVNRLAGNSHMVMLQNGLGF